MRAMRENPSLNPADCQGVDLLDPLAHYYEAIGAPLPRPRLVSPEQMVIAITDVGFTATPREPAAGES